MLSRQWSQNLTNLRGGSGIVQTIPTIWDYGLKGIVAKLWNWIKPIRDDSIDSQLESLNRQHVLDKMYDHLRPPDPDVKPIAYAINPQNIEVKPPNVLGKVTPSEVDQPDDRFLSPESFSMNPKHT